MEAYPVLEILTVVGTISTLCLRHEVTWTTNALSMPSAVELYSLVSDGLSQKTSSEVPPAGAEALVESLLAVPLLPTPVPVVLDIVAIRANRPESVFPRTTTNLH